MELAGLDYSLDKHLPTPPPSHNSSPDDSEGTLVSVSTMFFPAAQHPPQTSNVVLLSQDSVYFYVHSDVLLDKSTNSFRAMLPVSSSESDDGEPPILNVPEPSPVLNIILHAIYDIPCAHDSPPFNVVVNAVDSMPTYGIDPKSTIVPSTPLFTLLLSQAPLFPIELFALAAHYDIFDLAVAASSHLLAFPPSRLSDQVVDRMGALYLKRLFFLHSGRVEAFKRVLGPPPHLHPPTPSCDFHLQKGLTRAWALATAPLAWDARPDMSPTSLESALKPLAEHLGCDSCKAGLDDRIKDLIVQWSNVKRTI